MSDTPRNTSAPTAPSSSVRSQNTRGQIHESSRRRRRSIAARQFATRAATRGGGAAFPVRVSRGIHGGMCGWFRREVRPDPSPSLIALVEPSFARLDAMRAGGRCAKAPRALAWRGGAGS